MPVMWVPATVTRLDVLDPKELVTVEFTLPSEFREGGATYPLTDEMRPGTAFLARPFGTRTQKWEKRLYTRSNVEITEPRILQTIINHTHEKKSNTSPWWTDAEDLDEGLRVKKGVEIGIRVVFKDEQEKEVVVFEHKAPENKSLKLESDSWWNDKKFVGLGFSTGVTPLFAHIRYMAAHNFGGKSKQHPGTTQYTLIMSVKRPEQLMFHKEWLEFEKRFPNNFTYHPVLTREWPNDWPYTRGRIITAGKKKGKKRVNLDQIYTLVSDIENWYVRLCGGEVPRDELKLGFEQSGRHPASFRAETW
ncbi:hypothetical protein MYX07_07010 [Patescibacteria group bacterium AH-259-L07]|nr:hypothetical protein [Patescibacteria group bacterium AH-259-L07]